MSSEFNLIKALKRKSAQKQIHNKENNNEKLRRTKSSCELKQVNIVVRLRKVNSEPDLNKIQLTNKKPLKFDSAKSERNINILYTSNHNGNSIPTPNMDLSFYSTIADTDNVKVPIVGFEIVAERSRFTIYKLRVENYENNNFWLVLRRFTDFTRLQTKLKTLFPHINLVLPKKKWFGNNFSSAFLDTRVNGLQTFINTILSNAEMRKCPSVREFFCLDEPPMFSEEVSEDCRIVVESQNETIAHLQMQLRAKDEVIANLTQSLKIQQQHNDFLTSSLLAKSSPQH